MTKPITHRPLLPPGPAPKEPPEGAAMFIEAAAADGFTVLGVAKLLGTSADTLRRWLTEFPDLKEAFDQGREAERYALHNKLFRQAMDEGNSTAAMFLLKARHGYREGDQAEQGNRVSITFNLPGAMPLEAFTGTTIDAAPEAEAVPPATPLQRK